MNNKDKGKKGEEIALKILIKNKYKIVDRNYKTNIGEIDIIAYKNNILIFIEVKSRISLVYGHPRESVHLKKQEKIIKTSLLYIKHKKIKNIQVRYDVIEIYFKNKKYNHIKNAFQISKY